MKIVKIVNFWTKKISVKRKYLWKVIIKNRWEQWYESRHKNNDIKHQVILQTLRIVTSRHQDKDEDSDMSQRSIVTLSDETCKSWLMELLVPSQNRNPCFGFYPPQFACFIYYVILLSSLISSLLFPHLRATKREVGSESCVSEKNAGWKWICSSLPCQTPVKVALLQPAQPASMQRGPQCNWRSQSHCATS